MTTALYDRRTLVLIGSGALLTVLICLAPGLVPGAFPIWPGAEFSDLWTAHLSTATFVHRSIGEAGYFPQWNPTILSGMPVLSDPLTSAFYPFHWPLFLWPTAAVATVLAILHIGAGALGLALYLRARRLSGPAAAAGAVAFSGMPKLIGHFGLGHLTLVYSIAWTPWLIYFIESSFPVSGRTRPRPRWLAAAALSWGLMALADVRWAVIAGLLTVAVAGNRLLNARARSWLAIGRLAVVAGLAGVLIPMVQLVPALQWHAQSTRAALATAERLELSMPASQLVGIVFPPWGGWPEWMTFGGVTVLVLALIGLVTCFPRVRIWLLITAASLIFSMGSQLGPFGEVLWGIPGLSSLRVPPRFLFLVGLSMAVLAAYGADVLGAALGQARPLARRLSAILLALGLVIFPVLLWPGVNAGLDDPSARGLALLGVVAAICAGLLLLHSFAPHRGSTWMPTAWIVLIALELMVFNSSLVEARTVQAPGWLDRLQSGPLGGSGEHFRIFSPSHSVPQQAAAAHGLEIADGVHPLIYAPYWNYMAGATGFDPEGYSVSLPPYPTGDPSEPWGVEPDPVKLGRLNVLYLISAYPLEGSGWELQQGLAEDDTYVYRNPEWSPRAWVEPSRLPQAWISYEGPDEISVVAVGPGTLRLSELAAPGWSVALNGERATPVDQGALIQSIPLTAGEHQIRLRYRTPGVLVGSSGTLAGLVLCTLLWRKRE